MGSKIEWTNETWNPVTGCTPVGPGCDNCYAKRMAPRLRGRFGYPQDDPFAVTVHPGRLTETLYWKTQEGQRVFVCSMGDLFHREVPWEFICEVFDTMAGLPGITFQVLTKRPGRMAYFAEHVWPGHELFARSEWPSNVWAGVSIPNARYLPWLDVLARIPAPVRFVSLEPLLGPVDLLAGGYLDAGPNCSCREAFCPHLTGFERPKVDWAILGFESGPRARPGDPAWARKVRDDCQEAGIPFFMKQMGTYYANAAIKCFTGQSKAEWKKDRHGSDLLHLPSDLRIREFPA